MFSIFRSRKNASAHASGFNQILAFGPALFSDLGVSRGDVINAGRMPSSMISMPEFDLGRALTRSTGG